jgi:hypothetical protein
VAAAACGVTVKDVDNERPDPLEADHEMALSTWTCTGPGTHRAGLPPAEASMMKAWYVAALVSWPLAAAATEPAPCIGGEAPREAVSAYLQAMQARQFKDAYAHLGASMTDGLGEHEWVRRMALAFPRGGVSITGIDIREPRVRRGAGDCSDAALVPNVLRSRDRINVDGIVEFELYDVVRTADDWRIVGQETLYDTERIIAIFPDVEIVELGQADTGTR